MNIRNMFGKKSNQIIASTTLETLGEEVESDDLILNSLEDSKRFVPVVDYTNPTNFARYGSAEKYYKEAIENIWKTFPYDGSLAEQMAWKNKSSDLTNYIFDNSYPRVNGFITIGRVYGSNITSSNNYGSDSVNEYIFFKGGPNTVIDTNSKKDLFTKSNKLSLVDNRGSNLAINGIEGNTAEFFLNKSNLSGSNKQVIFDLWNSSSYGNSDYGRFRIEIRPGIGGSEHNFFVEYSSGSSGVLDARLGTNLIITGSWNHYAITAVNNNSTLELKVYENKILNQTILTGSSITAISGSMIAQIGALITTAPGSSALRGWGKLSGSLDEFRFWKTKRTDRDISRYWFTSIGGGSNTDVANTKLGVYFKFNEGIYDNTVLNSYDSNVLDYSGRVSNGFWTGYSLGSRNVNSAIVLSNAADTENKDPIIYSTHPDVVALNARMISSGSAYDVNNNAAIFNSFPEWISDDDNLNSNGLRDMSQIMAEFFDNFHLKIEALPSIKENVYRDGKALPFAKNLLTSVGFKAPELFVDSSILETFLSRNENINFVDSINDIKNSIYQNIYNNLLYIYRSKGTEKSIRNLIRCFGIDDELIKINLYSNNATYTFDDRFQYTTERKKYINFNNVDRFDSTIYQMTQSSNTNSVSYISGNSLINFLGTTLEAEVMFPKKFDVGNSFFFNTDFVSCSLFGMHEAAIVQSDLTWQSPDRANFQIYAIRPEEESSNVRFILTSSLGNLASNLFYNVYNDQKWNFAVKVKHEKYPYSHGVVGSSAGNYILEFYGVNAVQDIVQEEFLLTASVPQSVADSYFSANKRIYAGAHRINFNGAINTGLGNNNEQFSDAKISSIRFWHSILPNEIVTLHAKDVFNFGSESPTKNIDAFMASQISGVYITQADTLAMHWDFENVTSSDGGNVNNLANSTDASFVVLDVTSGSNDEISRGILGSVVGYQYTGKGDLFPRNDSTVISREYVYSGKRRLPETLNNDDLTAITSQADEVFTRETRPVNHYFAIEKSLYQNISEEMLKWLGTVKDFNNLIGQPKSRYESEYKLLMNLRQMFFKNISNDIDFERFVDFYKWIDDSITNIIYQLVPSSMNISKEISNVVESHILERNKYRHKLPTFEFVGNPPIGAAKTIGELKFNWRLTHAPISLKQNQDCLWWLNKAERKGVLNPDRNTIFQSITQIVNRKFTTVCDLLAEPMVTQTEKKRDSSVLKQQIGFDLSGANFFEISGSFILENKDCTDS